MTIPPRWPAEIESLGPRTIGPFDSCVVCGRFSFARYGEIVLCLPCAKERAANPQDELIL